MPTPTLQVLDDTDPLAEAVLAARRAAHRDSNDTEIDTLQHALRLALSRLGVAVRDLTDAEVDVLVTGKGWVCEECGNAITQDGTIGPDHKEDCAYHDPDTTMCEDNCGLHVDHDGRCKER